MPWKQTNVMEQRTRFLSLAQTKTRPVSSLCRAFGISRKTGYKWLKRAQEQPFFECLKDQSRRPRLLTNKISGPVETLLVQLRQRHPCWGARKLLRIFSEQHPQHPAPCERTVNRIFFRNGLIDPEAVTNKPFQRFERPRPNDLWQMDYKGEFAFGARDQYCFPLTVLDDHSRFNVLLDAHTGVSWRQTQASLIQAFREYGLPVQILTDHGSAWYATSAQRQPWTQLTVWLMRLGIEIIYSRIRHPQTHGKVERFHRTLKYDLIKRRQYGSLHEIQTSFDHFRREYNGLRPHEAIGLKRPEQHYTASLQRYPEKLPPLEYPERAKTKKLSSCGTLAYRGRYWFVSEALANQVVMLKEQTDQVQVYYANSLVRILKLKEGVTE
jgi:transposase InsO family protein